jgi:biotin carboxyl carrier protein
MSASKRPGKKAYLLISLFALFLVLFPFLFWYGTWFGRPLDDAAIDRYFADTSKPRHAQHALVQVGERISHNRPAERWYPEVIRQSSSPSVELRQTAAWIMGQVPTYQPFHNSLLRLLHDPEAMVRRNAALALAAFRDPAARPELVAMLKPFTVMAPAAGPVHYRLKLGDYLNPGTMIAHIGEIEVRSPVPGEVRSLEQHESATVKPGDPLADIAPDKNHVWEALRALYLVGEPADLEAVEHFTRPVAGMPETVVRQAMATAESLRSRRDQPK